MGSSIPPLAHHPHSDAQPLKQTRHLLPTSSGAVADSSILRFLHSPPHFTPWIWSLKPELLYQAPPTLVDTCFRAVRAEWWHRLCRSLSAPAGAKPAAAFSKAPKRPSVSADLPTRGLPRVQEPFLFHSSLPGGQVPSLIPFSFFFFSTRLCGDFLVLSEVWGLLPTFSR